MLTVIRCIGTVVIVSMLLQIGLKNTDLAGTSISYLYSLGFGTVTAQSVISMNLSGDWGLMATVLISNSPQVLLSFLYLTYNGLFTCMLLAEEWSGYAHRRKTLRVTSAKGSQRSTYWLQLPYRYSIPLLVLSGSLHWLVSQSIFLARVTVIDETGVEDPDLSVSTCGYSNIAIIFLIIFASITVLLGLASGFRRYEAGMPLVGSCSAAISAACHPPEGDTNASGKPLMWGCVDRREAGDGDEVIGHCSFTSLEVHRPIKGQLYGQGGNSNQANAAGDPT